MSVGLDLVAVREALATQIQNYIGRPTNVYAHAGPITLPAITVVAPAGEYVSYFQTMGPDGMADVLLELHIVVSGRTVDAQRTIDEYLSAGVGHQSSIVDAIHDDRTLGGAVQDCVCLRATGPGDADDITAICFVQVIIKKEGAAV